MSNENLNKNFELIKDDNKEKHIEINKDNFDENILINKLLKPEPNFFNERKTKISLQRNYEFIIKGFIQIKEEKLIPIFHYLNKIGIPILKIIVNGFIDNDFEDENQENLTLKMISNCINFCYNKNLLYFIYKKLSKYFRRHDKYKDLQSIKRFEKLFTIWKILYNLENISPIYKYNDNSSITFYSYSDNNNKSMNIKIKNDNGNFELAFKFIPSPILNINKNIDNFYFIKIVDYNNNHFTIKYDDIFIEDENNEVKTFSQISEIRFIFIGNHCNIYFNYFNSFYNINNCFSSKVF